MIDYFAIGLTHGLLALACWRLLLRADLDADPGSAGDKPAKPWLKGTTPTQNGAEGGRADA